MGRVVASRMTSEFGAMAFLNLGTLLFLLAAFPPLAYAIHPLFALALRG